MSSEQIKLEVNHIFEGGANEIRVINLIGEVLNPVKTENSKMHEILGKINSVMWKSYMVKERGIKPSDCDEIMSLLEEWAND